MSQQPSGRILRIEVRSNEQSNQLVNPPFVAGTDGGKCFFIMGFSERLVCLADGYFLQKTDVARTILSGQHLFLLKEVVFE